MSLQDDLKVAEENLARVNSSYQEVLKREYNRKGELEIQLCKTLQDEFGVEKQAVYREKNRLQREYEEIRDRIALESVELPYPEGTILLEWKDTRDYNYKPVKCKTGNRAVIQVFRKGDEIPVNQRWKNFSISVGDVVLRELKKDGTPGKKFERWIAMSNYHLSHWLPVDQVP